MCLGVWGLAPNCSRQGDLRPRPQGVDEGIVKELNFYFLLITVNHCVPKSTTFVTLSTQGCRAFCQNPPHLVPMSTQVYRSVLFRNSEKFPDLSLWDKIFPRGKTKRAAFHSATISGLSSSSRPAAAKGCMDNGVIALWKLPDARW